MHPEDARYRVSEWTVTLATQSRPKSSISAFSNEISLNSLMSMADTGDRLVIEILKVQRLNFENEIIEVPTNFLPMSIPIN